MTLESLSVTKQGKARAVSSQRHTHTKGAARRGSVGVPGRLLVRRTREHDPEVVSKEILAYEGCDDRVKEV